MKNIYFNSKINSKICYYFLQVFFLIGILFTTNAQLRVPFTQRTSQYTPTKKIYNVKGDFTMIGNTSLTLQNYSNTTNNNNVTMQYVDIDGSINGVDGKPTFNSSSSELTFSTENGAVPSCSNIVYAGLYWTGKAASDNVSTSPDAFNVTKTISGNSVTKTFNKRNISLKGPNASAYTQFTASASNINYPNSTDAYIYSAYTEVTDYVRLNGIGTYIAADIALLEGNGGGTGYSGGWGLIVIYENSKMKYRDITIFDGHAFVLSSNTGGFTLPVSGFNTVQTGAVGVKLGLMASEGDVALTGDYFQIQKNSDASFLSLNHSGNTASNFFNSSINTGGNNRNPNLQNNTGIDITMFNVPNASNSVIGNNQTSTNFKYGTGGDTYAIFAIAMAVDAYIPEVENILTTTSINNIPVTSQPYTSLPGQEVGFNIDIKNLGTEAISNYKLIVPIPYNATYVAGSAIGTVLFTPLPTPNTVTFDPTLGATGSIVWNFGTLPLPASPSTLLAKLSFKLKATTDCQILSNSNCGSNIVVNGSANGVGAITGISFTGTKAIQGYTQNGTCIGQPIAQSLSIGINSANYVLANCQNVPVVRNFSFCNASSTVSPLEIASNFPAGVLFYDSFPVTINSVQFTDSNPFPLVSGTNATYYAVPSGSTNVCNFPFTIVKCRLIVANDDAGTSVNGANGGIALTNVLVNDTLNGVPVLASQVNTTFVSSTNTGITLSGTNVLVAAGTPAGSYTLTYSICEIGNLTNCDTAIVTVTVAAPIIDAVNNTYSNVSCSTNGSLGNVLSNDTLNGSSLTLNQVNYTLLSGSNSNITIDNTGSVNITPGIAVGSYTLTYKICQILNPSNCDTATVTVTITDTTAPVTPVLANVTGQCSATASAPTTTDTCAGTLTATTSDPLTYSTQGTFVIHWTFNDGNGNSITVNQNVIVEDTTAPVTSVLADVTGQCSATASAPKTTDACAGTLTATTSDPLTYNTQGTFVIHWTFNDGNGNTTNVNQNIIVDDTVAPVAPILTNVTGQCSATATPPIATDACVGQVTGTTSDSLTYSTQGTFIIHWTFNDGNGNSFSANQTVIVDDTTAPDTPVLTSLSAVCSITVPAPTTNDTCVGTITATTSDPLSYTTPGDYLITWTFNDGNGNSTTATQNVTVTPSATIQVSSTEADCNNDIAITFDLTKYLPAGTLTNGTWSTTDPTVALNLDGSVFSPYQVPTGDHLFNYVVINGGCTTSVEVTMTVDDNCTVEPAGTCIVIVHNAVTPNLDGFNDFFFIENLEDTTCFPTNGVEIYNRWGVLVYETKQYDNNARVFKGESEGRLTVAKSSELPTGTYFYIINYTDAKGNNNHKEGYLYLTK